MECKRQEDETKGRVRIGYTHGRQKIGRNTENKIERWNQKHGKVKVG